MKIIDPTLGKRNARNKETPAIRPGLSSGLVLIDISGLGQILLVRGTALPDYTSSPVDVLATLPR